MPSRSARPSAAVVKGLLSLATKTVRLDLGDAVLKLTVPRSIRRQRELQNGRLYYARGKLSGDTLAVEEIFAADTVVPTADGLDQPRFVKVMAVLASDREALLAMAGVLDVRAGYVYVNGWTTKTPALVVTYDPGKPQPALASPYKGVPVDLRPSTPQEQWLAAEALTPQWVRDSLNSEPLAVPGWEMRERSGPLALSLAAAAKKSAGRLKYVAPPGVTLTALQGVFDLLCHSSPDAGWPVLEKFLADTGERLTIAMYDFTAPHIAKALTDAHQLQSLSLVLDPAESLSAPGAATAMNPKAHDEHETQVVQSLKDTFRRRFTFAWAAVKRVGKTTQGIFPTAYHIKVAVADRKAVWLSSGNWQSSNQPDFPILTNASPDLTNIFKVYNREWHMVVSGSATLAQLFEKVIQWDLKQAAKVQVHPLSLSLPNILLADAATLAAAVPQTHAPQTFRGQFTIQPLLTPDNYLEHVSQAIDGAKHSLRIQNQYINLPARGGETFIEFLTMLRQKGKDLGENFRVIVRDLPGVQAQLEALEHFGFNMDQFKRQPNTHTKGVIIDDCTLIIGSHNWSNQGVLENRDASLLISDRKVAGFYAQLFDHDWQNLAHQAGSLAAATRPPLHLNWSEYIE
jgi:hypothetical protein